MSQDLAGSSPLFSANVIFINELYQKFIENPASLDKSWHDFFVANQDEVSAVLSDYFGPSWSKRDLKVVGSLEFDISSNSKKEQPKKDQKASASISSTSSKPTKDLNIRFANLVLAYKKYGHLSANLDPLGLVPISYNPEIDPKTHDISDENLNSEVEFLGQKLSIAQANAELSRLYCSSIGCEFEYLANRQQSKWLAAEYEKLVNSPISKNEKHKILKELVKTENFEQFLHKRFPGAKRFSVEGGESSICAIEKIIDVSAKSGVKKIVMGMAHRGRLNALTGVFGKPYHSLIAEFQGKVGIPESATLMGDVKYHMGFSSSREIAGNKIDLSLAFNPSHLEAVNSVVCGKVRAIQDLLGDQERKKGLAILVHGDAAFVGQGSVIENLVMNGVDGYDSGGVIHLIINNQIGFTANPKDSRSTTYASDLAKAIEAPIFHVNGDDVEAVVKIAELATNYRQTFKKDVVIDLICYRKYGHNELDEPLYTQPVMYAKIKEHQSVEKIYSSKLISEGLISKTEYEKIVEDFAKFLNEEFDKAANYKAKEPDWLNGDWNFIVDGDESLPKTSISKKKIQELTLKITESPSGFTANPKILRQLEARRKAIENGKEIDWGTAEALAFASLIDEGNPVRITGQDAGRGTFSHRHSILHDLQNGNRHNIFSKISTKVGFEVYDSVLSEYGVLGFEYGYSLAAPKVLTIWEAQFGDFANGAQIIFDQFIASSEVKWLRKSGLVMLLPHGYEGQGPEHSSARLERYLQACADNNLRVVNITNPANFFHVLRRQIKSKDRKPLVVMSPKSLLRHPLAISSINEFCEINFRPLIPESEKIATDEKIRRVILCSGKVYFDLLSARLAKKISDVAILRLEQLYPFPDSEIASELKKYKNAEVVWCQEEPKNMGAWHFVDERIEEVLVKLGHKSLRPKYVGRVASASPATGYASYHAKEQEAVVSEALK